jgi:hypothetical protein
MTGNERLAHLAYVLRWVPMDRFNLCDWDISNGNRAAKCGFAGCAVGWATQDHLMQTEGLTMHMGFPVFMGRDPGWGAVREFFEVDQNQAEFLFSLGAYNVGEYDFYAGEPEWTSPPPVVVADRIEEFLAQRLDTDTDTEPEPEQGEST